MSRNYTYQNWKPETMARVYGRDIPISTKQSVEICKFIKGKSIERAKKELHDVLSHKMAVPFTRFNWNIGHKPGIGPGAYPENASAAILTLLESVEANAVNKNLDAGSLVIVHAAAQFASRPWRYGRQMRRKAKRSHVEIVVAVSAKQEKAEKKEAKSQKPETKHEKKAKQ